MENQAITYNIAGVPGPSIITMTSRGGVEGQGNKQNTCNERRPTIYDYLEPTTVSLINHIPTPRCNPVHYTQHRSRDSVRTPFPEVRKNYPQDSSIVPTYVHYPSREELDKEEGRQTPDDHLLKKTDDDGVPLPSPQRAEGGAPTAKEGRGTCECKVARMLGDGRCPNMRQPTSRLCKACDGGACICACTTCRSPPFNYHMCTCPKAISRGKVC